jgi:arabinofuranosyltransferase
VREPHTAANSPDATRSRAVRLAFRGMVGLFLVYAGLFIYRTSFVIAGERYFSLFDDAMISMRYARNLAHGYGLVWNPGTQPVEGYTNPAWVLYMTAVHLLPLPASKTSLVVQLTAALLLATNLFFVREMAEHVSDGSGWESIGAVALTAAYLPLNHWSLQGMEVGVLALVVSISLSRALSGLGDGRFRASPYLLLGAATLVRPDMVVPLAGLMLYEAVVDPANRRRHLAWGAAALVIFVALQTALRLWYFGQLVPNTFYLKMTGYPFHLRISRGAFVLAQFIWRFNPLLFALPFLLLVRRKRGIGLLLWMVVVQMVYSVYVGGDAWEYWGGSNRYIAIVMPAFFVLLSSALFRVAARFVTAMRTRWPDRVTLATFASLVAFSIFTVNSIYGVRAWLEVLLIHPPLHSGQGGENHGEVEEALTLRRLTTPDAVIAVVRAGTIPYFADRTAVDLLGKNDPHIAREASRVTAGRQRFVDFRPGHTKFDYRYSIELQRPDVVVQLWHHREEVLPYLRTFYTPVSLGGNCVYVQSRSPRVRRELLPVGRCGDTAGEHPSPYSEEE